MTMITEAASSPAPRTVKLETPVKSHWRPTLASSVLIGLTSLFAAVITPTFALDSFYALYTGRAVAHSGPPQHELFTTAGVRTWVDQQWLAQWLFYETDRLAGYAAVVFLCVAAVAVAGVLLARLMARHGGSLATPWASAAVVAVIVTTPIARTQTLAYPLFIGLLWVLTDSIREPGWRPSRLVSLPLLLLWANLHGSVLLGAALAAACFALEAARTVRTNRLSATYSVATAAACLAVTLATPYGLSTVHYYASLMGNPAVSKYVNDWAHLRLTQSSSWPFLALLVVAALALALARRHRKSFVWYMEIAVAAILIGLGFYAVRYAVWAAIAAAYVGSVHGRRPNLHLPRVFAPLWRATAAALLVVFAVALAMAPDSNFVNKDGMRIAKAAEVTLDRNPQTAVVTDDWTSVALLWFDPRAAGRVAFDIRYEQYKPAAIKSWVGFLRGNPTMACEYGMVAVTNAERPKLVKAIRSDPAWTPTYDGKEGIVAVRTPGTPCS